MSMNAANEPTGSVQLDQVINPVYIRRRMQTIPTDPKSGLVICGIIDTSEAENNTLTHRLTAPNEFQGAAPVADNDAAPEESLVPTATNISGQRIGIRSFVLDGPSERAVINTANAVIDGLRHAQEDLAHRSALNLFPSIAAVTGDNTTALDLVAWDAITGLFHSSNHDDGTKWAVFGSPAVRQLRASLRTTAASIYATSFGDKAAAALNEKTPGKAIPFDGYMVHQNDDVPPGDVTGITGAIGVGDASMEDNAGICRIRFQRVRFEMQRDASRYGTWVVTGTVYGVGIAKQTNLRAYITRTTP